MEKKCPRKRMVDTTGSTPDGMADFARAEAPPWEGRHDEDGGYVLVWFSHINPCPTSAFRMHGGVLPCHGNMISKAGHAPQASSCRPSTSESGCSWVRKRIKAAKDASCSVKLKDLRLFKKGLEVQWRDFHQAQYQNGFYLTADAS